MTVVKLINNSEGVALPRDKTVGSKSATDYASRTVLTSLYFVVPTADSVPDALRTALV